MITAAKVVLRRLVWTLLVGAAVSTGSSPVEAQVPIPLQEQIELFNSLPPAQQQALIRELQRQLPPAQRQAIVSMLSGEQPVPEEGFDPEITARLDEALQRRTDQAPDEDPEKRRLRPGDTIVVEFSRRPDPRPPLTPDEALRLDDFESRLLAGNPYELDATGQLLLPGVAAMPLAGLNVDEATIRIQAERALRAFTVVVTRLPLEPVGTEALTPFGYDLFERRARGFSQMAMLPVPADYVLGPGDTIRVQLFGNENTEYFLEVGREGTINFPQIGPINVSGMTFTQMRDTINERVEQQLIGVRASVTLGELRSIHVFVLGEAVRPGRYSVSGLSTLVNALFESGGIKPIGSLRNIALIRNGQTIATLDLYDLLLRGDTRGDVRLEPGDAIFVPPLQATVGVDGEVRRPAIYELKNERTVGDVIALAGGLTPNANRTAVKLERIVPNRGTRVEDVDVSGSGAQTAVRDGDVLHVLRNLPQLDDSVELRGNVFQPGLYQWHRGMRLADLLPSSELVKPMTDLSYVLIRREVAPNVRIQIRSADLAEAWRNPNGPNNVPLEPRDIVHVFNLDVGRQHIVEPIVNELRAQAPPNAPVPVVRVGGQVRAGGTYPLEPGMRISDLLRAGGGLSEAAYANDAELTRYAVVNGEYRETELVTVNLAAVLRGDAGADLMLSPYDYLNIKEVSRWRGEETVTIRGEVVFPGPYPIRRGERLSSVLQRAGGLTDLAFPEGSVFTREELRERERQQLESLASRIERDLAAISITDPNASATISTGQSLVAQLRNAVATGRLVIRLDDIVRGVAEADVVLKDGDQLFVPERRQEVTVLGEVQYATSHVFERGLGRFDYINKSGGLTQRADKKRIYVVRANGEVVVDGSGRWFRRGDGDIRTGDTIVVPLELDQPLARWTSVTQIVYNLAVAAAAVASF